MTAIFGVAIFFHMSFIDAIDQEANVSFSTTLLAVIKAGYLADIDDCLLREGAYPEAMKVAMLIFLVSIVFLVSLNALIALMGSSYEKVAENASAELCREKTKLLLELMRFMPRSCRAVMDEEHRHFMQFSYKSVHIDAEWEGHLSAMKRHIDKRLNSTLDFIGKRFDSQQEEAKRLNRTLDFIGKRFDSQQEEVQNLSKQVSELVALLHPKGPGEGSDGGVVGGQHMS
eukprot:gnl/TRDRNA2_/TRDRNA2_115979_c0_seq1.p1 gnl/TRDRNA2_/TRDRNA2_115979_c0~~gnl/TRDRNA2_/TRDRNA2_115979_c0_seq1.p1  ORF type:complete len:229 (-),score=55.19 gnl/TRDRNA2_/TRDRNA2_115979_c0_seq1:42-728(-)